MRSLPSVYELLPRYQAVLDIDGEWKRVSETKQDINHLDRNRARQAYEFYTEIDAHYKENRTLDDYHVPIVPIYGWGHPTTQSAVVTTNNNIKVGMDLPPSVDAIFANGDGTVPQVSAIPLELNDKPQLWWPINQKHATMQNNKDLLTRLKRTLTDLQGQLREPARGLGQTEVEVEKGIGLQVDDVYLAEEPVTIHVTTNNHSNLESVFARIESVSGSSGQDVQLNPESGFWKCEVSGLVPGTYRVTVQLKNNAVGPIDPVADIFEVV